MSYRDGTNTALLVRRVNDKYELIDGYHRYSAAKQILNEKLANYKKGKKPTVKISVILAKDS